MSHSNIFRADRRRVVRRKVETITLNSTNTDVFAVDGLPSKYRLRKFSVFDASTSLGASGATLGVYTDVDAGGTALVTPATLTGLTAATKVADMTVVDADYQTADTLYLRNGVAHGSAATVSVVLEIEDLTG